MLWQVFTELNATRQGGIGPSRIALQDYLAWQQLHDVSLTPWEIETLIEMDIAALNAHSEGSTHEHNADR